jgi:hypothetical protein
MIRQVLETVHLMIEEGQPYRKLGIATLWLITRRVRLIKKPQALGLRVFKVPWPHASIDF